MFVSKPHFLDADPVYLSYLDGPKPNRSIHDAFLNVEPVSLTVNEFSKHVVTGNEFSKHVVTVK